MATGIRREHINQIVQLKEQLQEIKNQARTWGGMAELIYPKIMRIRVQALALAQENFLNPSSMWARFLDDINEALEDFPMGKGSRRL